MMMKYVTFLLCLSDLTKGQEVAYNFIPDSPSKSCYGSNLYCTMQI